MGENRYERFYFARFKRGGGFRKNKSLVKNPQIKAENKINPNETVFFVSKEQLEEKKELYKSRKEISKKQMAGATEMVNQQKSKRKYLSFIFLLINIAVISLILVNQAQEEGFRSFSELMAISSGDNFKYIYVALLGFPLLTLLDASRFYLLIYKATKRGRHFLSYKVAALGKYYDLITPLSTGGQPFQVYYLNKRSVKGEIATSVPLAKYIFSQIMFVGFAIVVLITNIGVTNNELIVSAAWVGVLLNFLLLAGVFVLSISKKIGPRIVIGILKLLSKLRIVKNYETAFLKVMRFVREYQKSMRYFTSNIFVVGLSLLISLAYILVQASIPYFIYAAFNGVDPSMWWPIVSKLIMLEFAVSFVPLPGGAGAAEFSFVAMFKVLFPQEGAFFWALLIWRFIVYYAFILQGILVVIYDVIRGNKKAERLKLIGFWKEVPKKINPINAVKKVTGLNKNKKDS